MNYLNYLDIIKKSTYRAQILVKKLAKLHTPREDEASGGENMPVHYENAEIKFPIKSSSLPARSSITSSIFSQAIRQSEFKKIDLSESTFSKLISKVDFQQANLFHTVFEQEINDCNFINASLGHAEFKGKIKGFTCFSGSNLDGAQFYGDCADTVIFIGAKINPQNRPKGGIQTVEELKNAIKDEKYTKDELLILHEVLKFAHIEVGNALKVFTTLPYHINENHLDHLFQAIAAVDGYLKEQLSRQNFSR
ncbi:TPA: pentapeptide repeat-containing protein [Legionella anisa]